IMLAHCVQPSVAVAPAALIGAEVQAEVDTLEYTPGVALMMGLPRFLVKGLGNQVGLHVYDQDVPFDLNLASFVGQTLASFEGRGKGLLPTEANLGVLAIAAPVAACTAPVYISVTVQDGRIVDDYLDRVDKHLPGWVRSLAAQAGDFPIEPEFYRIHLKGGV